MSNELWFLVSGVLFFLWVVSLVIFNVPDVWGELSGSRARKQLKIIKSKGESDKSRPSEDLRVLHQESLLDEELVKVENGLVSYEDDFSGVEVPKAVRVESVNELEETGVLNLSNEELSTGIIDNEKYKEDRKKGVRVLKVLSNVEGGKV